MASRSSPGIETSSRLARWWVWPTPITAAGCFAHQLSRPFHGHRADEVLLEGRPARRVREHLRRLAGPDPLGRLADADAAGGEHRVGGQRAAGRVDPDVVAQSELAAQDQLLVAERRVQLGDLDTVQVERGAGAPGAGGAGQVTRAHAHLVDVVRDPGQPRGPLADLVGLVAGGQHDRGSSVGDGRAVVLAQRVGVHRPREQLVDRGAALADRVLVLLGVGQRAVDDLGHRPLVPEPRRRCPRAPGAPPGRRCRARSGSSCRAPAAGRASGAARPPSSCRTRRRALCPLLRSGS